MGTILMAPIIILPCRLGQDWVLVLAAQQLARMWAMEEIHRLVVSRAIVYFRGTIMRTSSTITLVEEWAQLAQATTASPAHRLTLLG